MTPGELLHDRDFRRGARDMGAFAPAMAAWGIVSGVAMTQTVGAAAAVLMSLTVFAGSAQLASLPLFATGAPMWVIWAASFCVNVRFLVFSAQWRRHLVHLPRARRILLGYFLADLNLVVFQRAWPARRSEPGQVPYILGGVAASWLPWQLASMAGIFLSSRVPLSWGLAFAGTLSMLGIAYSLLTDRTAWVAGAVSAAAAVATFALPLKLNILVAIAAAVAAGLVMARVAPVAEAEA